MLRPRFTIRSLLVIVAIGCCVLGWLRWQEVSRQRAIAVVERMGGTVFFDEQGRVDFIRFDDEAPRERFELPLWEQFPHLIAVDYGHGWVRW